MKFRVFLVFLLLALFVGGIYFAYRGSFSPSPAPREMPSTPLPETSAAKVEAHIRENIAALSPEPPVFGGTFAVTKVTFLSATRARVEYGDGHNAYRADVDFFLDPPDFVKVLNFTVVERN